MSNKRRVAEANVGAFYGGVVPTGPAETEDEVSLEPVHSNGTVALPLHPADKG